MTGKREEEAGKGRRKEEGMPPCVLKYKAVWYDIIIWQR